jgi:5-methylcytosine-specific restriction endonuclease McrA
LDLLALKRLRLIGVTFRTRTSRHQVDHVIAEEHGGQTTLDNLALSCTVCNRRKGSDIGSLDPDSGTLIPLFNPRTQQWSDHLA